MPVFNPRTLPTGTHCRAESIARSFTDCLPLMHAIRSALSRLAFLPLFALVLSSLAACDSGPSSDGLDLDRLFNSPTASEIMAVESEWARRSNPSRDARIVAQTTFDNATIYIVSHTQTTAGGGDFTHYGIVRIPDGASDWPVVVYHHGGDDGISAADALDVYSLFPMIEANTVLVAPVYRSETLDADLDGLGGSYTAGGDPSPWDYDVDDAIGLLNAALDLFPTATDAGRIGAFGISRGGETALLQAVRDDRVQVVADYFGPSDFFNLAARFLAFSAVLGTAEDQATVRSLPGGSYLIDEILLPLHEGAYSYDDARLELVRRSPGLYGSMLPSTQLHHHVRDGVVPVQFSQAFIALIEDNPVDGTFDATIYGESGEASFLFHRPNAMPESIPATDQFLYDHLLVPTGAMAPAI